MPLSSTGEKVLASMQDSYGSTKGGQVISSKSKTGGWRRKRRKTSSRPTRMTYRSKV